MFLEWAGWTEIIKWEEEFGGYVMVQAPRSYSDSMQARVICAELVHVYATVQWEAQAEALHGATQGPDTEGPLSHPHRVRHVMILE